MADLKTTNIFGDAYINNKVGIATNTPATRLQIGQLSPTAATEGIQFGDDTNARIYRGASGQINFNGTINVLGNTYLGDANGDTVYVNDTIRIGATDSGDASLFFGEGSVAGSDYGARWYWDSGYTFYWYTRNNGTDTQLFNYVTNDLSYVNWNRNFNMQNYAINYNAQIHFNAGTRFVGNNTSYLIFKSDSASAGGILIQDGNGATKGYTGYWDSAGGGILNNTGNWAVRYNFGSGNSGGQLYGDWLVANFTASAFSGAGTGLTGTAANLSIGGTASNITAYTINQNLGTGNSPTFVDLYTTGNIRLRNTDPTITFSDTNATSSFIHVNANTFFILCGPANSSFGDWQIAANSRWPMEINLSNNNATFGGNVDAISFSGAGTNLTGTAASLTAGTATSANALNTSNNYQVNSIGIGMAGSGTAGKLSLNQAGVRSWSITPSGGRLVIEAGDGLGSAIFACPLTSSNFVGPGTGLTGTAASLTAGTATTATTANALNTANNYTVNNLRVTGNIGIGTTSPQGVLEAQGSTDGSLGGIGGQTQLWVSDNRNQTTGVGGGISFAGKYINSNATQITFGAIRGSKANSTSADTLGNLELYAFGGDFKFHSQYSQVIGVNTELVTIKADGKVGIGISTPSTLLHVNGIISGSSFSGAGTGLTGTAASLTAGVANSVAWTNVSGRPTAVSSFANDSGYLTSTGTIATASYANALNTANNYTVNNLRVTSTVGIGTTSPQGVLEVQGSTDGSLGGIGAQTQLWVSDNRNQTTGVGGGISFAGEYINSSAAQTTFGAIRGSKANSTSANTVGNLELYAFGGDFKFHSQYSQVIGVNTELVTIKADGKVGIGNATPRQLLHINGSILLDGLDNGYQQSATRAIGYGSNSGTVSGNGFSGMDIQSVNAPAPNGGNYSQNLRFWTHHYGLGTGGTPRMFIQYDGNVGIGTIVPSAQLHVNSTTAGSTLLRTDGTNGTLFSVVDDLSDSLMSVNNSAGLPVLEVFADDRVIMGQYGQNDFVLKNNRVGIGTTDFSYTTSDNNRYVGTNTNNRLFVSGSIQLLGNNDAIVFGRGTATFLTDEELGFGWGGGWYMTDGTYLRVRADKTVYTAGEIWASIFRDSNDNSFYLDPDSASVLKYEEGQNQYSFRGANRATNDWENSGLTTVPTVNDYNDGSWYIDAASSNNWSRGLLSKRRFRRVEGLTFEYESYLQSNDGNAVHCMIGFVGGNTINYSFDQTPANVTYQDNTGLSVFTNGGSSGTDYNFDTRNSWYRFKTVLKGTGAFHYVYRNGIWNLIKETSTNNQNDYEWVRVLISLYRQRIYFRDVKVYVAQNYYRGVDYISNIAGTLSASVFSGAGTGLTGTAANLTAGAATTATNSTQLGGVAAASYVTLTDTQTLTNKTITGSITTASYANALNAANQYTVGGITGSHFGTSSWASNATTATTANTATALTSMNISQFTNNSGYLTSVTNISGNAGTATLLQNPKNIGGVSFNGSANIDLPGVNIAGNQNTSGTANTATTANALNTANNYTVNNLTVSTTAQLVGVRETYTSVNISSGVVTIDLNAGTVFRLSYNAVVNSFTINNITAGKVNAFTLVTVPAIGAGGINFTFTGTNASNPKWPSGNTPMATTTANKYDVFSFIYDGSNWYGFTGGLNY